MVPAWYSLLVSWKAAECIWNGCAEPKKEEIQPLTLNFNSRSDRFYDYLHMPWYTRPQQTRQPSIDGPFVDLYGTELYIVAFFSPYFFLKIALLA